MNYRRRFIFILLGFLALFISACQAAGLQTLAPTALPLSGKSASRLGAATLSMQQSVSGDTLLVPVSVESGNTLSDAQPLNAHDMLAYAFSPDRGQMAFISGATPGCISYCLHLLDLRAWKENQPLDLDKVYGVWVAPPAFSADATRLAVPINDSGLANTQVKLVDLVHPKVIQVASLPGTIFQAAFTPQGDVAIYASNTSPNGKNSPVFVALLDGNDLHTLWQQDLSGVSYVVESAVELSDPSLGQNLIPAAVFTPDGSRLYVAAADQPILVTVDFSARKVQSATIQPRAGLLERLMALGTSVVYAKMLNGISKSGVLSQDGRTFYVLGTQTTAVKGSDGMYTMKTIPLGVQIIDTADGALLSTYQTDASSLALSLDGKSLLLNGWGQDQYGTNNLSWTDVLDLATLKVTQRLEGNFTPTRLLDGSLVWQGTRMNPDGTYQLLVYRPNASAPFFQYPTKGRNDGMLLNWITIP